MTKEDRLEYSKNRIETAYKTIEAAKLLAENGFWNSAINRLYYAIFYAVNALLVCNEIYPQSHSGLKSQYSLHFIKTGKMEMKYGKLLAQLYDWRQKGDYENMYDYDSESVKPLFEPVIEMITEIEKEIKTTRLQQVIPAFLDVSKFASTGANCNFTLTKDRLNFGKGTSHTFRAYGTLSLSVYLYFYKYAMPLASFCILPASARQNICRNYCCENSLSARKCQSKHNLRFGRNGAIHGQSGDTLLAIKTLLNAKTYATRAFPHFGGTGRGLLLNRPPENCFKIFNIGKKQAVSRD